MAQLYTWSTSNLKDGTSLMFNYIIDLLLNMQQFCIAIVDLLLMLILLFLRTLAQLSDIQLVYLILISMFLQTILQLLETYWRYLILNSVFLLTDIKDTQYIKRFLPTIIQLISDTNSMVHLIPISTFLLAIIS